MKWSSSSTHIFHLCHDPYYTLKHIYRPFVNIHEGLPHQLHWEIV
jgi:hypothetical protein